MGIDSHAGAWRGQAGVVGAVIIVLLSVSLTALGFAALRPLNHELQPAALTFAASAAIGLAAGFTSRWTLQNRSAWLCFLIAASMTVIGLVALALLAEGGIGLVLIRSTESMVWKGLGQIMVGFSVAILALRAWRRPAVSLVEGSTSTNRRSARRSAEHAKSRKPRGRRAPAARRRSRSTNPLSMPTLPGLARLRSNRPALPNLKSSRPRLSRRHSYESLVRNQGNRLLAFVRSRLPTFSHITQQSVRRVQASKPSLRLSTQEEHRCPYCLDVVENHDARGIHICLICHTWHHADCWSIAGACQVPHHQA